MSLGTEIHGVTLMLQEASREDDGFFIKDGIIVVTKGTLAGRVCGVLQGAHACQVVARLTGVTEGMPVRALQVLCCQLARSSDHVSACDSCGGGIGRQ